MKSNSSVLISKKTIMGRPKVTVKLTAEKAPTVNGGRWWPSTVAAVIQSA